MSELPDEEEWEWHCCDGLRFVALAAVVMLGTVMLGTSACNNKHGPDGVMSKDQPMAASTSDDDATSARDSAVSTSPVLIAGVSGYVTSNGPPLTVRFTIENRGASAATASIVSVEVIDLGVPKALKITNVEADGGGKRRDHDVIVVVPKQTVMVTIWIEGELSPDAQRYAFRVSTTIDGAPRVVDTIVTRAIRHPVRPPSTEN